MSNASLYLTNSFIFARTEEGGDYWHLVYCKLYLRKHNGSEDNYVANGYDLDEYVARFL
jgi:hypothetical protein